MTRTNSVLTPDRKDKIARSVESGVREGLRAAINEMMMEAEREGVFESQPDGSRSAGQSEGRGIVPTLFLLGGILFLSYLLRRYSSAGEVGGRVAERLRTVSDQANRRSGDVADQARSVTQRAADRVEETGETAAMRIEEGGEQTSDRVEEMGDQAEEAAENVDERVDEMKDQAGGDGEGEDEQGA